MKDNMTVRLVTEEEMEEVRQLSAICFDYPYEKKDTAEETNQSGTEGGQTPQEQAAQEHEEIQQEGDGQKGGKPPVQPRKDRQYGAFTESGELMASMAAIPLSFYYEGKAFTGFGVGGVSTYPHHRKKGAIRAMFEQMLRDAYDEGRLLSYLYPFSESFYGRFGYCRMNNSTMCHIVLISGGFLIKSGKESLNCIKKAGRRSWMPAKRHMRNLPSVSV